MLKDSKVIKISLVVLIIGIIAIILIFYPYNERIAKIKVSPQNNAEIKTQTYSFFNKMTIKDDDWILGNKKADLKIFVYEDYSNLYSAKFAQTLDKVLEDNDGEIAIIIHPYLSTASPESQRTALAMYCAGNKWEKMRKALFTAINNNSLDVNNLSVYAKEIGMKEDKFNDCLQDSKQLSVLDKDIQEIKKYNILGSPTTFIDNEMILGARPYDNYVDSNGDLIQGLSLVIANKLK